MLFGWGNKALLTEPSSYASPRKESGPPKTRAEGASTTKAYDYVIVGAGTAGSVLASRLSEDPNVSVLVLEAGGDQRGILETKIPLTFTKLFHGQHDWNYYTTPQSKVGDQELYWPRGKMIGGSSSMNAMMSHQCDRQDFDEWAEKFGCKGWGYNDIAPYMRKSEKFTPNPNRPLIDVAHRGDSGPWLTGYSHLSEIGEKGFLQSCEDIGIPYNPDINTPDGSLGCTRFQSFIDAKGQRSSAATAYLTQEVINRPNLDIAVNVRVTRVLFDTTTSANPEAIGVELKTTREGPSHVVLANREVLICGGAVNTPQTLLLSGIGAAHQLSQHNIPLIKNLPAVGTHLKDHFCSTGIICKSKPGTSLDYLTSDIAALPSLIRWLITGGGPVTSNVGEAAAFIRSVSPPFALPSTSTVKPRDYGSGRIGPDIEIIGAPIMFKDHGAVKARPGECIYSMVPIGLRPQSHGTITLKTSDVFDYPLIDPKYWTDKDDNDRKVLLVGIRVCLAIMRSPALQAYLDPVEPNDDMDSYFWPYSSSDINAITDEQLMQWMGKMAFTLYHPVGTARMGPSQEDSVVDLQCRVHGVKGLRVVDASIMPEQISGHPTAPIIAIAEKMSDVIVGKVSVNADATRTMPVDKRVPLAAAA